MSEIRQFSAQAMREIARMIRWWRALPPGFRGNMPSLNSSTRVLIAKTQAGGVPAMVGTTPGTADVDLWDFDADGELYARTDAQGNQVTVEAVNIATDAVNGERWIHLKEHVSGRLLVDWELCAT